MLKQVILFFVFFWSLGLSYANVPKENLLPEQIRDEDGRPLTIAIKKIYEDKITYEDGCCHFFEMQVKGGDVEYEVANCRLNYSLQRAKSQTDRKNKIVVKGKVWVEGKIFRTRHQGRVWSKWKSTKNLREKSWYRKTGFDFQKKNGEFEFKPTIGAVKIRQKMNLANRNGYNREQNQKGDSILILVIPIALYVLFFVFLVYRKRTVGDRGEIYTMKKISAISKGFVFRDVYVNGSHDVQQIDVVAVTEKGIIVVEKKTYTGLIVGGAYDSQWRVYYYGRQMYMMKNPHHQNYGHIQALRERMPAFKDKFIDLVIFGNNSVLGDNIPPATIYDSDFELYYRCLPTILNAEEMETAARNITMINGERDLMKRIHKGKIKRLNDEW